MSEYHTEHSWQQHSDDHFMVATVSRHRGRLMVERHLLVYYYADDQGSSPSDRVWMVQESAV